MNLIDPAQLTLHDELNARIQRSIRHLQELNTEEMRVEFTHPNDFWHWGADYMGRWIAALGLLSRYAHQDYGVSTVVRELIQFQNRDGSFGTYTDPHDFQEWFGMGRGLIGLLEYYEVDPDPAVLESAVRLGEYYIQQYPDTAECMFECYSNGLEGLVRLAQVTQDPKFLSAARRVAETSVVYHGIRYSEEVAANGRRTPCAGQVHCQLATARGLLDLYELTGDEQYLGPAVRLQAYIVDELLWITGGIGFYYFRPEENETCADADWFRLNLQLWRLTGNAAYMHLAERILVNQLYFNQADNGAFCYLRGLQNRAGASFDACCSHHGPRALYEALRYTYTSDDTTLWINLYSAGEAECLLGDQPVRLKSTLRNAPDHMLFSLRIDQAPDRPFSIRFRVPLWTRDASFRVNDQAEGCSPKDGYAAITRLWRAGDRLEIKLPFFVSVHQGETLGKHVVTPSLAAVSYGPQLFCLNDSWNSQTRVHLVKLKIAADPNLGFIVRSADRLEARGLTPENSGETLIFSPLAQVSGTPSGAGRIHTVRSPYYKVWIPCDS